LLEKSCKSGLWARAPDGICGFCDVEAELSRRFVPNGRPKQRCLGCKKFKTIVSKSQYLSRTCMALLKSVNGRKQEELEFLKGLGIVRLSDEKYEFRVIL
jgi:hypothetical protein